jgi:hypothetical protein
MKEQESISLKDPTFVIPSMEALKQSPGWKIIQEVLTSNIKSLEETILDSDESWTPEKLTKFRDMRYFEKQLLGLPERIIAEYSQEHEKDVDIMGNLDPYKDVDNS